MRRLVGWRVHSRCLEDELGTNLDARLELLKGQLEKRILILDGATGTELQRRGIDIYLPLWSARALIEAPEVGEHIPDGSLDAGAGPVIATTVRTHRR